MGFHMGARPVFFAANSPAAGGLQDAGVLGHAVREAAVRAVAVPEPARFALLPAFALDAASLDVASLDAVSLDASNGSSTRLIRWP